MFLIEKDGDFAANANDSTCQANEQSQTYKNHLARQSIEIFFNFQTKMIINLVNDFSVTLSSDKIMRHFGSHFHLLYGIYYITIHYIFYQHFYENIIIICIQAFWH